MDIDTADKVRLDFDIRCFGDASYQLYVNDQLVNSNSISIDLLDAIDICLRKKGEGLVDISEISINDKQIMPLYLIHALPPTNRLESEDTWNYSIYPNFYVWYHHISGNGWIA
jgi:hypothetical protein